MKAERPTQGRGGVGWRRREVLSHLLVFSNKTAAIGTIGAIMEWYDPGQVHKQDQKSGGSVFFCVCFVNIRTWGGGTLAAGLKRSCPPMPSDSKHATQRLRVVAVSDTCV